MRALALAVLLPVMTGGCAPGPAPIVVGQDSCDRCHMAVADARFAAELVTRHGRIHRFDSVECLAAYFLHEEDPGDVRSLWVTDLNEPKRLLRVEDAEFVRSAALHTPMGAGLAAFEANRGRGRALAAAPGEILSWPQVLARVQRATASGVADGTGS
jgi:copper chaperone NosL